MTLNERIPLKRNGLVQIIKKKSVLFSNICVISVLLGYKKINNN